MVILSNEELKINEETTTYDLEELIVEGKDARVPIEIEFPNGKKAAAMIRPLCTNEFKSIYNGEASDIIGNILEKGLMNKNGVPLSKDLIDAMPIGLPAKIIKKIFEISGIETNEQNNEELVKNLNLFP